MNIKKLALICTAVMLPLASCSPNDESSDTGFNEDDVMFAQMMIPHHEQAVEMSDIALDPNVGAGEAVRGLALEIKAAQDPEIDQMTTLLEEWGQPIAPMDGMDHGSMMKGMLSPEELESLGMLTGTEFDAAWATAMIAHHEGAIAMAEEVLERGSNKSIKELAETIIATQRAEIEVLQSLLS